MDNRRMCPHCRAFITAGDKVCPYCGEKVGPRAIDVRASGEMLMGFIPNARYVTYMILLIDFALFAGDLLSKQMVIFQAGADQGILVRSYHQYYRLVTAGYLHGNLLHIAMNCWALFDLGAQVEELYGPPRLIAFFSLSSAFGFWCSAMWHPLVPSVGSSAGIFGLIGAMIALGLRTDNKVGRAIRGTYIRWAIYGLLFGLLPGIDNTAHLGGLASGFVIAYFAGLPGRNRSALEMFWRAAATACVLTTAFCFFEMYRHLNAITQ